MTPSGLVEGVGEAVVEVVEGEGVRELVAAAAPVGACGCSC